MTRMNMTEHAEARTAAPRIAAMVLAFAACGALSSFIFDASSVIRAWFLFPLPFGILMRFLCARGNTVLILAASIAVWNAAYWSTIYIYSDARAALAFLVGGVIGGAGIAAAAGFDRRALWSPKMIGLGAAVGGVAALEFLFHLHD